MVLTASFVCWFSSLVVISRSASINGSVNMFLLWNSWCSCIMFAVFFFMNSFMSAVLFAVISTGRYCFVCSSFSLSCWRNVVLPPFGCEYTKRFSLAFTAFSAAAICCSKNMSCFCVCVVSEPTFLTLAV